MCANTISIDVIKNIILTITIVNIVVVLYLTIFYIIDIV